MSCDAHSRSLRSWLRVVNDIGQSITRLSGRVTSINFCAKMGESCTKAPRPRRRVASQSSNTGCSGVAR